MQTSEEQMWHTFWNIGEVINEVIHSKFSKFSTFNLVLHVTLSVLLSMMFKLVTRELLEIIHNRQQCKIKILSDLTYCYTINRWRNEILQFPETAFELLDIRMMDKWNKFVHPIRSWGNTGLNEISARRLCDDEKLAMSLTELLMKRKIDFRVLKCPKVEEWNHSREQKKKTN